MVHYYNIYDFSNILIHHLNDDSHRAFLDTKTDGVLVINNKILIQFNDFWYDSAKVEKDVDSGDLNTIKIYFNQSFKDEGYFFYTMRAENRNSGSPACSPMTEASSYYRAQGYFRFKVYNLQPADDYSGGGFENNEAYCWFAIGYK